MENPRLITNIDVFSMTLKYDIYKHQTRMTKQRKHNLMCGMIMVDTNGRLDTVMCGDLAEYEVVNIDDKSRCTLPTGWW